MIGFKIICTTLILIFSVEDLLGSDRVQWIERIWLEASKSILIKWRSFFDKFIGFIKYLLFLFTVLVIIYTILSLCGYLLFKLAIHITNCVEGLNAKWVYYLIMWTLTVAAYLFIVALSVVLNFILASLFNYFIDIVKKKGYFSDSVPLFEFKITLAFYKVLNKLNYISIRYSDPSTKVRVPTTNKNKVVLGSSIMSSILGLMSIFVVFIFTTTLFFRTVLTILAFSLWIVFFSIPNVLSKISKYTGNKSYFKVGKYIIAVIMYVLAWIFG